MQLGHVPPSTAPQHSWSPGWLQVSKAAVSASVKLEDTLFSQFRGDVTRRPYAAGVRSPGPGLTVTGG